MKFIYNFTEKYLSELSIRDLLLIWALMSIFGVVTFTVAITMFNHFLTEKQELIINDVLHLENNSRKLDEVTTDLFIRNNAIQNAKSKEDLDNVKDFNQAADKFEIYSQEMLRFKSGDQKFTRTISTLRNLYEEFVYQDSKIVNLVEKRLQYNDDLEKKIAAQESLVTDIDNHLENMIGVVHLRSSRVNKKFREILNTENVKKNDVKEIASLIEKTLPLKQRQLEKSSHYLESNIENLIKVVYTLLKEQSLDILLSIRENKILQYEKIIDTELHFMAQDLKDDYQFGQQINELEESVNSLVDTLLNDDDSLYSIKTKMLVLDQSLVDLNQGLNETISLLSSHLEAVAMLADSESLKVISETRKTSMFSFLLIIFLSSLFILNILFGIAVLVFRIEKPLEKIKVSMSALSKGKLSVRLEKADFANDEFRELSEDFNHFSQANEDMINKLNSTRLELLDKESRISAILENALVGIVHIYERRFISVNKKFEEMTGYTRDEMLGQDTMMVYPDFETYQSIGEIYEAINDGKNGEGEWQIRNKNGQSVHCNISATLIDKNDQSKGTIWIYADISERKQNEEKLHYLAKYDTLTNLPNRAYFNEKLETNLREAKEQQTKLALMFLDLDRFKYVNDSLGHNVGDDLLREVANKLKKCLRVADTVARLGGDEFIIILSDLKDLKGIEIVASKIISSLNPPISLAGHKISITPSIGISIFPENGTNVTSLVKNADAAMYRAKEMGRNNYQYYTEDMNSKSQNKIFMDSQLSDALEKDEFVLFYQPQVNTITKRITGFEALLRWDSIDLGLVSPAEFIPQLEESGLIIPVGEWVIRNACMQLKHWHQEGRTDLNVSVNLSVRQFHTDSIVDVFSNILTELDLEPHYLDIEITETILMEDVQKSEKVLNQLHELGIQISMDDFGTGYSSLAYLKRFPFDVLKIDQSFVRDILENTHDTAICEAIIEIGQRLKMKIIAEGVETVEQYEYLKARKCDAIQGYLFGKPVPASEAFEVNDFGEQALDLA